VEHAALGGPVPLRREQQPPAGEPAGPFDEMDVGFLARLDKAQLGVDGTVVGDDPLRPRLRAVQSAGVGPRRPAVAGGWCVRVVLLHHQRRGLGPVSLQEMRVVVVKPAAPRTRGTAAEVVLSQRRNSSIEGNGGRASP
jgi:hypothetical protein